MLARTYGPKYASWPAFVQPKLNGIRALSQKGNWQSRDEIFWQKNLLAHLANEMEPLWSTGLIFDGELYVHGWPLQRINSAVAVKRKEPTPDTLHVQYHIFDIIDPKRLFSDRWFEVYHGILAGEFNKVQAVPTGHCTDTQMFDHYFWKYTEIGYEGIMLRPDGPYEFGEHFSQSVQHMTERRSRFLWKHKQWEDDEFLCVGYTQGEGKADIGIGALVFRTLNDREFSVGTGFSDEDRILFHRHTPLGQKCKIRYLNLSSTGIPLNPSFLCICPNVN